MQNNLISAQAWGGVSVYFGSQASFTPHPNLFILHHTILHTLKTI